MIFKVENTYLKTIIWQNLKETAIQCTIIHALPQTAEDSHIRIARLIATPPEKNYYIASLLSIQLIKKKKISYSHFCKKEFAICWVSYPSVINLYKNYNKPMNFKHQFNHLNFTVFFPYYRGNKLCWRLS